MLEYLLNKTDKETPTQVFSCEYCEIFPNSFLYRKPRGGCFCQFDKVTIQCWASLDLLLLIKNTIWDGFC